VQPGPTAERTAEATRKRLLIEVAERRNPRTKATVDQLLERYLDQFDGAPNTLTLYRGYVRNHISPHLGHLKVGQVDADILDSFYAELRRCRRHCTGRHQTDHRTPRLHDCDQRCHPHACRPLGRTTVRHMHFILSGAYKKAVRWRWVSVSPIGQAEPPAAPTPNPEPPTPEEAARIVNEAWRDPAWGSLLWMAMTTGARRGELCAVRRSSLNLDPGRETMWLRRAVRKDDGGKLVEAELKTHQQRRIALDPEAVTILQAHLDRQDADAAKLGITLGSDVFVFSDAPDCSAFLKPDSVTQRYDRLAERLGITTTLHKLRHFSATELIAAGVDIRTVAGRLGHAGGGTTTLRTYTAWVSEADQRAATGLGARMPPRPVELPDAQRVRRQPRYRYEVVAAKVADRIERGELKAGSLAPTAAELCAEHEVAIVTARRAVALLKDWG
jgi:integrase